MPGRRIQNRFRRFRRSLGPERVLGGCLLAVLVAASIGYVVIAAWVGSRGERFVGFTDLLPPRLTELTVVLWLAFAGASIGSFLNVVAWRMPRGMTIRGRSLCPRCRTQLRARDNFPVFGWLFLGGRCRTCRLPISSRYPIVESLVGATVVAVGVSELSGIALPYRDPVRFQGPLATPAIDAALLRVCVYHVFAVSVAWAYGLIRFDGHDLPPRLALFGTAVSVLPMLADPTLMVVPWQVSVDSSWRPDGLYLDAVVRVVTGLAAAVVYARGMARTFCPAADPKLDPLGTGTRRLIDLCVVLALPAVVVGWQALPAVVLIAAIIGSRLRRGHADSLGRFAVCLPAALTLQIVFWQTTTGVRFWPGVGSEPVVMLIAAAMALTIPHRLLAERGAPRDHSTGRPERE